MKLTISAHPAFEKTVGFVTSQCEFHKIDYFIWSELNAGKQETSVLMLAGSLSMRLLGSPRNFHASEEN